MASYFRQTESKSATRSFQMPPERHETVIQLHSGSNFSGDNSILSNLVKEKDHGELARLRGISGIRTTLQTNFECGIRDTAEEISRRKKAFGLNSYYKPSRKSFFHFVWEGLKYPIIVILLVCAALSLGFGIKEYGLKQGWYDGGSIFVAVFLFINVSAVSDLRQSRQFDKLSDVNNNIQVEVVRAGKRQWISIFEIVVGDVVYLGIGAQVPADGLFIDGHSLLVDESSMTGESDLVQINGGENPFLLSGTKVADGFAKMLVTSVGMSTLWGEMMSSITNREEQTPLQARLNKLTSSIGKVGLTVAFVLLVVLLVRYFTGNTTDENGKREFVGGVTKGDDMINAVVRIITVAVTIVVVAIPEGLPLAVTLTLAYSMRRIMADQAVVRKLSACETVGYVTTTCTGKTGLLTLNQMKVTKFWQGKKSMEGMYYTLIARNVIELLHQGVGLNTTGSVYKSSISRTNLQFSGSPTEKAILSWAVLELNMDMEAVKRGCNIMLVEAFNSERRRSGILMKKVEDNTFHVHWKGAAEMILAMCSHYYDSEGNMEALNEHERTSFNEIIRSMAAGGLRCIAFAHKQVVESHNNEIQEDGLTLLGLVGLKDPCRSGVEKAVRDCKYAGVNVKMITGDNVFTAKAVATECGILCPDQEGNDDGSVVEGVQFRTYTEEERMEIVDKIVVMARSSPFDKLLLVQCLKKKGHVVAVTGDDTYDLLAMGEADIGLSMGIHGSELAKESSDIVILDDNFASVVEAVRWGRCVYNNIQKFIQFQLTANVAALAINFVAALSTGEVPLTIVQLLWVNLIMDTLGALALATERPSKELMKKPPVGRSEPLISNTMLRNIIGQALYQIAVILGLKFGGKSIFGVHRNDIDTLVFTIFVLLQVFNLFNAREVEEKNVFKGILRNHLFTGITVATIVVQVIMVELLNKFAHTERLDWKQWGVSIVIAAFSWAVSGLIKFIPVPERPIQLFIIGPPGNINLPLVEPNVLQHKGGMDQISVDKVAENFDLNKVGLYRIPVPMMEIQER